VLLEVLDTLAEGPDGDLLDWARTAVLLRYARATSSASTTLELASRAAVHGQTLDQLRAYPSRVDAVDSAAVARVMADCAGHEVVTWVGPITDLPGARWDRWEDVQAALRAGW
jgi:predicted Zn-dependent peptidase